MKFKVIEPKRNSVEPELDATPYVLTEDEQKLVAGGVCNHCHELTLCHQPGLNVCEGGYSHKGRTGCQSKKTWREEISLQ